MSGKKSTKSLFLNNKDINEHEKRSANPTLNHMLDDANNSSSTSASESLKQILKNAITQRANISSGNVSAGKTKSTQSNQLSQSSSQSTTGLSIGSVPAINSITDLYNSEALQTIQMLSTLECGQALAPLFTQFLLNIHSLALAKPHSADNSDDFTTNLTSTSTIPLLPDLIRKLAEDQIVETAQTRTNSYSNQLLKGDKSDAQQDMSGNCNNNVILKVPSYKPKTSSAVMTHSDMCQQQVQQQQQNVTISDINEPVNKCSVSTSSSHLESDERVNQFESKTFSLKEIIAKSISQRLYTTSAKLSPNVVHSEDSSSDALVSDDKYSGSCDAKLSGNVSDHSNPSTPEKRNRPKRGRYRNYNRDDLAKAVKAVQRGEMSVHRAGQ